MNILTVTKLSRNYYSTSLILSTQLPYTPYILLQQNNNYLFPFNHTDTSLKSSSHQKNKLVRGYFFFLWLMEEHLCTLFLVLYHARRLCFTIVLLANLKQWAKISEMMRPLLFLFFFCLHSKWLDLAHFRPLLFPTIENFYESCSPTTTTNIYNNFIIHVPVSNL